MGRPFGTITHSETKNRIIRFRLTARQYAQTKQVANFTKHSLSHIVRSYVESGLVKDKEIIIKCRTSNYLSKPIFVSSSSSLLKRKKWYSQADKLSYKKPLETEPPLPLENTDTVGTLPDPMLDTKEAWIKQDTYLAFLEESLTASLKEKQPSETDLLSLYEKSCKDRGIEPDLLFSQTLTLEQRDRREAKK